MWTFWLKIEGAKGSDCVFSDGSVPIYGTGMSFFPRSQAGISVIDQGGSNSFLSAISPSFLWGSLFLFSFYYELSLSRTFLMIKCLYLLLPNISVWIDLGQIKMLKIAWFPFTPDRNLRKIFN